MEPYQNLRPQNPPRIQAIPEKKAEKLEGSIVLTQRTQHLHPQHSQQGKYMETPSKPAPLEPTSYTKCISEKEQSS